LPKRGLVESEVVKVSTQPQGKEIEKKNLWAIWQKTKEEGTKRRGAEAPYSYKTVRRQDQLRQHGENGRKKLNNKKKKREKRANDKGAQGRRERDRGWVWLPGSGIDFVRIK